MIPLLQLLREGARKGDREGRPNYPQFICAFSVCLLVADQRDNHLWHVYFPCLCLPDGVVVAVVGVAAGGSSGSSSG